MKPAKLPAKIKGMKIIPASIRNYENAIKTYEGLDVVVTIAKPTKQRSNPQNNYLWAVPYQMIAEETGADTESIHHAMKEMFLSEKTSGPIKIVRSTTKLTTKEFSEYIDRILQWSAEFLSLYIPLPSEEELLKWIDDNARP
jgi:hypothetical protein